MFDNHTYSFLYGLFQKISPFLTIWYIYLYFFRLYPRMAKASLISETHKRNPEQVKNIRDEDVAGYMILSQFTISALMRLLGNRKNR